MGPRSYLLLLALVALERGVELVVSARNVRTLRARGGVEAGRGHYPAMVALHAGFLVACAVEASQRPSPPPPLLTAAAVALVVLAQALRWWTIATLGDRWTTKVIVLPGAAPVTHGPYRFLRHPNYLAVVVELAALPLVCGAWRTALAFSVANAVVLTLRIRAEERALGPRWALAFDRVARRRGSPDREVS
jgi:methyltransferase